MKDIRTSVPPTRNRIPSPEAKWVEQGQISIFKSDTTSLHQKHIVREETFSRLGIRTYRSALVFPG
jgi:hypothetical protein